MFFNGALTSTSIGTSLTSAAAPIPTTSPSAQTLVSGDSVVVAHLRRRMHRTGPSPEKVTPSFVLKPSTLRAPVLERNALFSGNWNAFVEVEEPASGDLSLEAAQAFVRRFCAADLLGMEAPRVYRERAFESMDRRVNSLRTQLRAASSPERQLGMLAKIFLVQSLRSVFLWYLGDLETAEKAIAYPLQMHQGMMPRISREHPDLFVPALEGARLFALEQRADIAFERRGEPLSADFYRAALRMMEGVLERTSLGLDAKVLDALMARHASVTEKITVIEEVET